MSLFEPIQPKDAKCLVKLLKAQTFCDRIKILEIGHGVSTGILCGFGDVDIVDQDPPRINLPTNTIFHQMSSMVYVPRETFDFVFIDGDHRYLYAKNDIERFWGCLRGGGVMAGHDYDSESFDERFINEDFVDGKHHGLIKAVNEKFGLPIRCDEGTIWWVTKSRSL